MTQYYARTDVVYEGGDAVFSIPFSYINKKYITVFINDEETKNYTYNTDKQIRVLDELAVGDEVSIRRNTPITERLVVFSDTSILDERTQNLSAEQVFDSVQEIYDNNISWEEGATIEIQAIQDTVDEAVMTANNAVTISEEATLLSEQAKVLSESAESKATEAVNTANLANAKATVAKGAADLAVAEAQSATKTANTAKTTAEGADTKADTAIRTANEAKDNSTAAVATANSSITKADTATANATTAVSIANSAVVTANSADSKATSALATAGDAEETAILANSKSDTAITTANAASTKVDEFGEDIDVVIEAAGKIQQIEGAVEEAKEAAGQATVAADNAVTAADNATQAAADAIAALSSKQDKIDDLDTIRANANLVTTKQDTITDLATIRAGASKGATALQSVPIAAANKVGGVAGGNWLTVNQTTGKMECGELTKAQYDSALGYTFIGKTTLNNVLTDYTKSNSFKTVNGESIIGSGDITISGGSGVFIAEYGVTTYNEITQALNSGQDVIVKRTVPDGVLFYGLNKTRTTGGNAYSFISIMDKTIYDATIYDTVGWESVTFTIPSTTSSVTSGSTSALTSGGAYTALSGKASTSLSNLSSDGKKVIDGQWVKKEQSLSTATAIGTYDLSSTLSSYLPDTTNTYEVLLAIEIQANNYTSSTYYYLNDYEIAHVKSASTSAGTVYQSFCYLNIGKTLKCQITTHALSGHRMTALAYRRIGTNS